FPLLTCRHPQRQPPGAVPRAERPRGQGTQRRHTGRFRRRLLVWRVCPCAPSGVTARHTDFYIPCTISGMLKFYGLANGCVRKETGSESADADGDGGAGRHRDGLGTGAIAVDEAPQEL